MEVKFYFTKDQIEKFLKKKGYDMRLTYVGNSEIKEKKVFLKGKEVREKAEEIFKRLLHEKLLS